MRLKGITINEHSDRTRRVKCDETRPTCLRCARSGWSCDGYPQPRHETGWRRALGAKREISIHSKPSQEPSFALFETDVEGRFYQLFIEKTAASLGGYFDLAMWDRIIQQASTTVSSIRHVVIALAALDLTTMATTSQPSSGSSRDETAGSDAYWKHHFALQQYSKAIKEMREDLSSIKQDLRTTLIGTILIMCFESYHGNYESALRQFYSGQQVLDSWEATLNPDLLDYGTSSPAPHIVEYEVLLTFHQLDIQILTHTDYLTSIDDHKRLKERGVLSLQIMPPVFQSIAEATVYGTIIIRRCLHFMSMAWMYDEECQSPPSTSFSLTDRVKNCVNAEAYEEQDKLMKEFIRWHDGFLPIFKQTRALEPGHQGFLAGSCGQMLYLTIYIGMVSKFATSEMFYDSLKPQFVQIVDLARGVVGDSSKASFTTAFRTICSLNLVAQKCRDPAIRREAIRLMLLNPRREGLWDSIIAAKVCLWQLKLEEEDMVGDFVFEKMRVQNIGVKYEADGQTLSVSCKQPKKDGSGMMMREGTIVL